MPLTVLTYREDWFRGPADACLWNQLSRTFGIKAVQFIDDGVASPDVDDLVVFDELGEIPLAHFEHPADATYLFGCGGMRDLPSQYPNAISVRIETPLTPVNQGLFGAQAAAIVLYDREKKSWP